MYVDRVFWCFGQTAAALTLPLTTLPSVYTDWLWAIIVLCSMIAFSMFSAMTTSGGLRYGAVMYSWIRSRSWKVVCPSLRMASSLIFSSGLHSQGRRES